MHMHGTQLQHFAEITDGGCPWAGTCHIEEDIRLYGTKPSVGSAGMTGLAAVVR